MKKVLLVFLVSIFFLSCMDRKQQVKESVKIEIKNDSSEIKKKQGIVILNEVDMWMKKGMNKEISTSEVNEKINPLMKKYEVILSQLDKKDSLAVQEYRIKQINKMIDLQMQQ
nr:hypothetical protein [uncultured Flavobacterium sp.]